MRTRSAVPLAKCRGAHEASTPHNNCRQLRRAGSTEMVFPRLSNTRRSVLKTHTQVTSYRSSKLDLEIYASLKTFYFIHLDLVSIFVHKETEHCFLPSCSSEWPMRWKEQHSPHTQSSEHQDRLASWTRPTSVTDILVYCGSRVLTVFQTEPIIFIPNILMRKLMTRNKI